MIPARRSVLRSLFLSFGVASIAFFAAASAGAQAPAVASRITQLIDENNLVTLHGNTHPLARPQYDQGAAPDNLATDRILLLLQRSPAQEAALRQLLDGQKSKSSPYYHQWLTPTQFGQQFGPSDADVQTITSWLESHGFTVNGVSAGRTLIDFSGNAGEVREAFHTEIHKYLVKGESHWANNADPQIPAALAPVIAGLVSLNNFPKKSMHKVIGHVLSAATPAARPGSTPTPSECENLVGVDSTCYQVAPSDFAAIYNSQSLWNETLNGNPVDGTNQTIAIVGETDIDCQDIINFRTFFGLPTVSGDTCTSPTSNVQFFLNGPDPGYQSDETEADLDVEWSGAVAKGAHIDFVESESTETTQGIDLSAEYIVDNNLAPVMSESYGECELDLGNGENEFYSALWEQAAAEGITAIVSAGDSGSAGCDDDDEYLVSSEGLAVSGLASTPFDVAVGGTDFNFNPTTDPNTTSTYWPNANVTTATEQTQESAAGYIPEIPWNDSCAASSVTGCSGQSIDQDTFTTGGLNIVAGGGGQSNCAEEEFVEGEGEECFSYDKPSWQAGQAVNLNSGASTDSTRDIPDVSLFAAAESFSNTSYPICESDLNTNNAAACRAWTDFISVGGTSSAAPAFAGIMAMVNEYMAAQTPSVPRQGNANFELYSLASAQVAAGTSCNSNSSPVTTSGTGGCTFYKTTTGSNSVPCIGTSTADQYLGNGLGCSNTSNTSTTAGVLEQVTYSGITGLPSPDGTLAWQAGPGYDLATGLGSINVYNLVHNWPTVAFTPTTTTLSLCTTATPVTCASGASPLQVKHGTSVTLTVTVSAASGTPSGDAALIGTFTTSPNNSGSLSGGVDYFTAENDLDDDHLLLNTDIDTLSSGSSTGPTQTLVGGSYAIHAHYEGNTSLTSGSTFSYGGSDSAALPVDITPENTTATLTAYQYAPSLVTLPSTIPYGTAALFRIDVCGTTPVSGQHPTSPPLPCQNTTQVFEENASGTVIFNDSGQTPSAVGQTSANTGLTEPFTLNSEGFAEYQTPVYGVFNVASQQSGYVLPPLAVGSHSIQASYVGDKSAFNGTGTPGDASYNQSQTAAFSLTVTKAATATTFPATDSTENPCVNTVSSGFILGGSVTLSALVATESYGNTPSGTVAFTSSGGETFNTGTPAAVYDTTNGYSELCASATYTPKGSETVTATYSGDGNYVGSVSSALAISPATYVITSPYSETNPAQIAAPGDTGTATLAVQDPSGTSITFSAVLSIAPTGAIDLPTCSASPSPLKTSGSLIVTCNTTAASQILPAPMARPNLRGTPLMWLLAATVAALALLLLLALPERRRGYALLVLVIVIATGAGVACGGGGGGGIAGEGGEGGVGGATGTTTGLYEYTVTGTPAGGTATVWFNVN